MTFFDVSLAGSTLVVELAAARSSPRATPSWAGSTTRSRRPPSTATRCRSASTTTRALRRGPSASSSGTAASSSTSRRPTTRSPARSARAEIEGFSIYALAGTRCGIRRSVDPHRAAARQRHERRPSPSWPTSRTAVLMCSIDGVQRPPPADGAVGPVRVADDLHLPRGGQPQVRGPGDGARRDDRRDQAPGALGVGGRAAGRHDRAGDARSSRARRSPANEITLWEFTGIDDQTIDLELEFECLLDGVCSAPATPCSRRRTSPAAVRGRGRVHAVRQAHASRSARSTRLGNVDPTPAKQHVDLRRHPRARHLDRPRPGVRDRGHDRDVHLPRRGGERHPGLRLRVRARRRRLHVLRPRRTRSRA